MTLMPEPDSLHIGRSRHHVAHEIQRYLPVIGDDPTDHKPNERARFPALLRSTCEPFHTAIAGVPNLNAIRKTEI